MSGERAYELYLKGAELAGCEAWAEALPLLEESWQLRSHGKTGLWISRCAEATGDTHKAYLFAAASHAIAPTMSDVATHFARLAHRAGDTSRAFEVLSSLQSRHHDYGPAHQLATELRGGA